MSTAVSLLGASLLGVILAGYFAQKYLPAPPPRIAGIDLGTTYSSIGVYHAVTGDVEIIPDGKGRKAIPSVVAFTPGSEKEVLVGFDAIAHSEHNPAGTFYDAKRFIGKSFSATEFYAESNRYPFRTVLKDARVFFTLNTTDQPLISPEQIGSHILAYLRTLAEKSLNVRITKAVLSVPAEFSEHQRNATIRAAHLAGLEVLRIINEPTAAALAYGLHKKEGVNHVCIVDLGGGTLDVSVLLIQGGMFLTRSMAGNNHLGGQDFNLRLYDYLKTVIGEAYGQILTDAEDLQNLRMAVENVKLELTYLQRSNIHLLLHSFNNATFLHDVTRQKFEELNEDLFQAVLRPIAAALSDIDLSKDEVDEVVLVGGSTRIPRVRQIIAEYFGKEPNFSVDPELAVVSGVAVQAGVIGGAWPLQVSATELPAKLKKIHVYS